MMVSFRCPSYLEILFGSMLVFCRKTIIFQPSNRLENRSAISKRNLIERKLLMNSITNLSRNAAIRFITGGLCAAAMIAAADDGAKEKSVEFQFGYQVKTSVSTGNGSQPKASDFRKDAEKGIAAAQHNLGVSYERGDGVKKDPREAFKWYAKAAEQGYAPSQNMVGAYYCLGIAVDKNPDEAVKWFRKAAEQNDAQALENLAVCYEEGTGVKKDPDQAFKLHLKASELGNERAQTNVGACFMEGTGTKKNPAEAVKWFRKAAENGDAVGQYNLALCYADGIGVKPDPAAAAKWAEKAAKSGHKDAPALLNRLKK
ncbi:MAG: sel1 repeat family protein [Lentisphaerae bacterium]|nr:sel1 repeat family protein [Lentisphaerota bacterium]